MVQPRHTRTITAYLPAARSGPGRRDHRLGHDLAPTQQALYKNPKIKKAFPFAAVMEATLADGVARPVLPTYSDISLAVQAALHPPADIDPPKAIEKLKDNLEKAKEGKLF